MPDSHRYRYSLFCCNYNYPYFLPLVINNCVIWREFICKSAPQLEVSDKGTQNCMKYDSVVSRPKGNKSPSLMHDCFLSYICGEVGDGASGLFVETGWGCVLVLP